MVDASHPELAALRGRLPKEADFEAGMEAAARLEARFEVEVFDVLPGATNCLVLLARNETVLRVPLCDEERNEGFRAQLVFSGRGGVEILAYEVETGSVLMPRIRPGKMLHEVTTDPTEEARICSGVVRTLDHSPIPGAVLIENWYRPFLEIEHAEAIPDALLRQAQRVAVRLLATTLSTRLLHGDLHHYNLLQDGDDWVSVDPKGVVADPAVEIAAFLRNPCDSLSPTPEIMSARIRTFAEELGYPAARIRDWGIAHNVLSAWWDEPSQRPRTIATVEAIRSSAI
ncbi:MAG TPA: aminoglycoside phosphotransferase family protein [Fimbriimonadaceae bacterium]|nr:aminoglycoside phosphotransferase family protein [Fimbriimonadaceae bacterium]